MKKMSDRQNQREASLEAFHKANMMKNNPISWHIWKRAFDEGVKYGKRKVNDVVLDDVIKCQCNHKIEDRFPTELIMKECEDCNGVL